MANLETLELTINGSAESAQTGISSLITRLSALDGAVSKSVSGLKKLNAELRELKKYGALKLPNLEKMSGSSVARAAKKAANDYDPLTNNNRAVDVSKLTYPGAVPKEKYDKEYQENVRQNRLRLEMNRKNNAEYRARIEEEKRLAAEAAKSREQDAISLMKSGDKIGMMKKKLYGMTAEYVNNAREGKLSAKQMANGALQINNLQDKIQKAEESAKQAPTVFQQLKKGVGNSFKDLTKGATNFFNRVKKVATTMLIRSAIRGLIKSVKEGINNLYEWSKLNKGEFAKSLDTIHAKTAQLKNSIGASIAPIIQAAVPAINALANAAISAFNYVNQLIALLTGQSYWTKAAEGANEYADAASGAGKAAKEWLASFDELNVMNNSGGGGGGSGLSGQFDDMFENVTKFDEGVREVAEFLKNNFSMIKAIALEIGAAILAWKLGNAFAETLPMLSKIMGFAATGLVIAITLQANWMLTNQYLDTGHEGWLIASMLTTAVGSTAAYAIAKKLIGGQAGLYAAGITLAFTAAADIVANVQHTDVSAFSKESVLTNIKAALSAGAATGILLKATGAAATLGTLGTLAAAGGAALAVFAIATVLKLATQNNTSIEWGDIKLTEEQIKTYVKEKMFTAEASLTIDKFNVILDKKEELEGKIQGTLDEVKSEWDILSLGLDTSASYERIKALIGDSSNGLMKDINDLCDVNVAALKLNVSSVTMYDGNGTPFSSETLLSGVEGWERVKKEMKANGEELSKMLFKGATDELTPQEQAYTQELLEKVTTMASKIAKAKEFGSAAAEFQTAALTAMNEGSFKGIIEAFQTMSSANEETIRKSIKENIASWYSLSEIETDPTLKQKYKEIADGIAAGFETSVKEELDKENAPGKQMIKDWLNKMFGETSVSVSWNQQYMNDLVRDWQDDLNKALEFVLVDGGFEQIQLDAMKVIGMSGWEYLAEDTKAKFIKAVEILESPETIAELKGIGVSATELFKFSDWESFTSEQRFSFLKSIKNAFGSNEAIEAAKAAGINIGTLVSQGLNSSDPKIKKEAQDWQKIIQDNAGKKVTVPVEANKDKVSKAGKNAKNWFTTALGKKFTTAVEATKASITKLKNDVNNAVGQNKVVKPTVDPQLASGFVTNLSTKIKDSIKSAVSKANISIPVKLQTKVTQMEYASGGFPTAGQLFIAREAGAEMVGSIGNRTAVANNDQIVAGVSSGVAAANEEQNALLRKQNQLLSAILAKTGNGGMQASSAMGRVIQQSLEMYTAVTGG